MTPFQRFKEEFESLCKASAENEKARGFFDPATYNKAERIALMHSELSEALETLRDPSRMSEKIPHFTHEEEEFADLLIRVMGYSYWNNLRLPEAIVAKMEHNTTRPFKHGRTEDFSIAQHFHDKGVAALDKAMDKMPSGPLFVYEGDVRPGKGEAMETLQKLSKEEKAVVEGSDLSTPGYAGDPPGSEANGLGAWTGEC